SLAPCYVRAARKLSRVGRSCSGEQGSRPRELTQGAGWAGDRDEGDAPAVHDGVQVEDCPGGRRLCEAGRGRGVAPAREAILLPPDDLTRGRPVTRIPDPRDKRIADGERGSPLWQGRAERAEA